MENNNEKIITAEQYVVNELLNVKSENESLKQNIEAISNEVAVYRELLQFIRKRMEFNTSADGSNFISFKSAFEKYDKEDFDIICKYFDFKAPEATEEVSTDEQEG